MTRSNRRPTALTDDPTFIAVGPVLIATFGATGAIVLQWIHFRAQLGADVAASNKVIAEATGLSPDQVKRAVSALRAAGVLVDGDRETLNSWDRTRVHAVNKDRVDELTAPAFSARSMHQAESPNALGDDPPIGRNRPFDEADPPVREGDSALSTYIEEELITSKKNALPAARPLVSVTSTRDEIDQACRSATNLAEAVEALLVVRGKAWVVKVTQGASRVGASKAIGGAAKHYRRAGMSWGEVTAHLANAVRGARYRPLYCGFNETGEVYNGWESLLRNPARIDSHASLYLESLENDVRPGPIRYGAPPVTGDRRSADVGIDSLNRQMDELYEEALRQEAARTDRTQHG